jgi:hypothetical protein
MSIIDLSYGLLSSIQEYLVSSDYQTFLNSSKRLKDVKFETIYFDLNWRCSLNYRNDLNFRSEILSKVKSARMQIALSFDKSFEGNFDFAPILYHFIGLIICMIWLRSAIYKGFTPIIHLWLEMYLC